MYGDLAEWYKAEIEVYTIDNNTDCSIMFYKRIDSLMRQYLEIGSPIDKIGYCSRM